MTTKGLVSIIIPARNERFLHKTIVSLLETATGPIEILPMLDGYWPEANELIDDARVHYIHTGESRGMRSAINKGAQIARGEFLLKSDAHCLFEKGFDEKLKKDVRTYEDLTSMDINDLPNGEAGFSVAFDNWIVIPRRKRLDAEEWCIEVSSSHKPPVDYEYLSSPGHWGAKGNKWDDRTVERLDKPEFEIDETPTFQGSCWFMTKNHYLNRLGGMSEVGYGSFVREAQEIGLKTWLGGGKVFVNKRTWYAHLHKGPKYGRMYFLNKKELEAGNAYCDDFWFNNRWKDAKYDLAWFVEHFMPMPTWTPEAIEQVRKK